MDGEQDVEPVFVRSKWGTARYVYNPRHPMGVALIVGSLLLAVGGMYYINDRANWSEGELRDAVHGAARVLEVEPQTVSLFTGYEELIYEAIRNTGAGPAHGSVKVSAMRADGYGANRTTDDFEIRSDDVDGVYCLRVSPPQPDAPKSSVTTTLSTTVEDHSC
ncbi:hypothetical protein AB0F17_41715 [Nonomuraea sp. NPDC026600]|uniref:hypothetical protein n=1 Tax=Nonomuraea sp. NPDC026600 TaxID=3155363 RepID=UPI0033C8D34D